ncbi:Ig-like domain-containing protein [Cohnella faecalis]|uniref:Intimin n=1 Tax=Cohnella faecalis TaxID=2315694 RepID=A0A398CDD8_9BACL|nr:Ig-like domain-containing protein [Cohnella faecalis]RIE01196.1 hypothetical protein D3H35_22630 [Cohnella faecalis]
MTQSRLTKWASICLTALLLFSILPVPFAQANSIHPSESRGYVQVDGGKEFTLALKADGTVWAWGYNGEGQLGNGTTTDSLTPTQVSGLSDITAIAAGDTHGLALKSDGTVWAWGDNVYGVAGYLDQDSNAYITIPVQVSNLSDVKSISAGSLYSLALKADGTVWAWGYNNAGQLGNGSDSREFTQVSTINNVVAIAAGLNHNLAVKNDGTVWAWGDNTYSQSGPSYSYHVNIPIKVNNISDAKGVAASKYYSLVLKTDGTVWVWGQGKSIPWQMKNNNGSSFSDVKSITAGSDNGLAIKSDGTVWEWSLNYYAQYSFGIYPELISTINDPITVSAGAGHSLAIQADGDIWAWGYNVSGQLGNGETTERQYVPLLALGTTDSALSDLSASVSRTSADGRSESVLTVKLTDKQGRPVQGHSVSLSQDGSSAITPLNGVTDAGGQASFIVVSTQAENVNYTAIDTTDQVAVMKSILVTFTADAVNTTNSRLTTSSTFLPANGTTSGTLTVMLRDKHNNPIPQRLINISQGEGNSIVLPISGGVTDLNGQASFLVRSTVAETITYTATDDTEQKAIEQTVQITFSPEALNAHVATESSNVEANGTDNTTLTVTLLDGAGTPIPGHVIALTQGSGISVIVPINGGVTDSNGQAFFTVANNQPETVVYSATDSTDQTTLAQTVQVIFYRDVTSVTLDQSELTLKVGKDSPRLKATVLPEGATNKRLIWTSSNPEVAVVGSDGLIMPLAAGTTIITVTTEDQGMTATSRIKVIGLTDRDGSTLTASASSVNVGSGFQVTLAVSLIDSLNRPMSGHVLVLSQGGGSSVITPLNGGRTNAKGQAWYTVTSTKAEKVTYTLTDMTDHVTLAQSAQIVFNAGLFDWMSSRVSVSHAQVEANGNAYSRVTVILVDYFGNPIPNEEVTLSQDDSTHSKIVPVNGGLTDANGVATFTVTNKYVETVMYSASVERLSNTVMLDRPRVYFVKGLATSANSTLTVSLPQVAADGISTSIITVTLKDSGNHAITNRKVSLSQGEGNSIISPEKEGYTDYNGQARFFVSNRKAETVTYTAHDSIDNTTFALSAEIRFTIGVANGVSSLFESSQTNVESTGESSSTLTVTLRDGTGNRIPNHLIRLTQGEGSSIIRPIQGELTDENGQVTFTVTNIKEEKVAYTAIDVTSKVTLERKVSINFYVNHVEGIMFDQSRMTLKPGDGTVALTARILPSNATNKTITWSSSDPAVARVDENGVITPLKAGTAIIKVVTADQHKEATCRIVVTQPAAGPASANISVTNNATGIEDIVTVKGLASGNTVKVYRELNDRIPIAQGTATIVPGTRSYESRVSIPQLGEFAGTVYVSVTSGSNESGKTPKSYAAEPSAKLSNGSVRIYNNLSPIKDSVVVSQLKIGDTVQVYKDNTTKSSLAKTTVTSAGDAQLFINQLGKTAGSIYVTIIKAGYSESERLEVSYNAEPSAGPSATAITVDNRLAAGSVGNVDSVSITGVTDNDVISVYDQLNDGTLLGSSVAGPSCTSASSKKICTVYLELPSHKAGTVYVSITKNGRESGRTLKAYLAEPSVPLNTDQLNSPDGDILIRNNYKTSSDSITVKRLSAGDVVKVFSAKLATLATSKPVANGQSSVTITLPQLGTREGTVYLSVIRSEYLESAKVVATYPQEAPQGLAISSIAVTNDRVEDTVRVTGLAIGDKVQIYSDVLTTDLLATGEAALSGIGSKPSALVSLQLPTGKAGKIYVTLTKEGIESSPTEKAYTAQPSEPVQDVVAINNLVKPDLVIVNGLAAGDVVKVYKDATPKSLVLATSNPVASGRTDITVSLSQFSKDLSAGLVYVSVIRKDYLESARVQVSYREAPPAAPLASVITVINRYGSSDTVTVSGLKMGDTVNVYSSARIGDDVLLGSSIAEQTGYGLFAAHVEVSLKPDSGSIYVTVSRNGIESDLTAKSYSPEPSAPLEDSQIEILDYMDNKLKDTIKVWNLSKGTIIKVYILEKNSWKPLLTSSSLVAENGAYSTTLKLTFPSQWTIKITQTVPGRTESDGIYYQLRAAG